MSNKVTLNPNDVLRQLAQQLGVKPMTLTAQDGSTYELFITHVAPAMPPTNGISRSEQLRRARIRRAQAAYWTPERRAEHGRKVSAGYANKSGKRVKGFAVQK